MTVSDDDLGSDTKTRNVTVKNVAPTITAASIDSPINENDSSTLTGAFTDPGTLDTFTLTVDWGEGDPVDYPLGTAQVFSASHQYLDDNPTGTASDVYAVSWTVTDDDTGTDTASTTVTVDNVAPTVTINAGPTSVNEGDAASHYTYSWTDPGSQDSWTRSTSCGPTGDKTNDAFDQATKTGSFDCAWPTMPPRRLRYRGGQRDRER